MSGKRPPQPVRAEELHTVIQVAEYLQIARGTVYKLIAAGDLPARRVGGSIRVAKRDLLDYVFRVPEQQPLPKARGPQASHSLAPLYQDPANLIDMSVWEKSNQAMRKRKGIPEPVQVAK